ncbi:uncharacterized protein [Rutidosis leptorrhynchoides]|uniref:uncharacterized protein n=1 Tax=Rutidosis leptorrhynchoides TaxID=125765 RepID=UPI003A99ABB9
MDSAVIHELNQGIQMAKQLRVNLNSAEVREYLIHKILSSYENALIILKSGDSSGQPWATTHTSPNFTNSSTSTGSLKSGEHNFDPFEQPFIYHNAQNVASNNSSPFPLPRHSPKKLDPKPTHHHQHESPLNSYEIISNTSSDHSVNTCARVPSPFDFPSTPLGFMEDYQQTQYFPNQFDDQMLQVYSPPFISPSISESNYFSEWGSSSSLDFAADADLDFNFDNSFF